MDGERVRNEAGFYLGSRTITITKEEFNTDPDIVDTTRLVQLFKGYYMHNQKKYHSRPDFSWAKQKEIETPEEPWRKLVPLEKNC